MVAALDGFHGWAPRADRNRRNACEETGIPALIRQNRRGLAPIGVASWDMFSKNRVGRARFEPVTSSVSGMAIPSDTVARRRVVAARQESVVVARRALTGHAWRRCHLVSHWLPDLLPREEVLIAIRIDDLLQAIGVPKI
jgi:hypothetical protein